MTANFKSSLPRTAVCTFAVLSACIAPSSLKAEDEAPGKAIFAMYCAACHGVEGAGLVGPNLTDTVFLHGNKKADILKVITNGVLDKGMPAWSVILQPQQIDQVADFAVSLIGKNLKSPFAPGQSSVTPFPTGSIAFPYVMRTFMPTLGMDAAVFAHHDHGQVISKYDAKAGKDVKGDQKPIDGIPSAMVVSFGDSLSYCFDTTECRLLYTWSGPFMDMTDYWGEGSGGSRKSFDYVPDVIGPVWWRAAGAESVTVTGAQPTPPYFTGYSKQKNIPELHWRIGSVKISLRITPGKKPGEAVCAYTVTGASNGLTMSLPSDAPTTISADKGKLEGTKLTLTAAESSQFTVTITPGDKPLIAAPPPRKVKPAKKNKKEDKE